MLAQLEKPTNDFHALARYLIHGRERPTNPNRVAWVMAHNLGTDDPELAAKLMTATAEASKRCRQACYHAMIAWREDERPSPEVMQEIARKTLDLAGLGEHQALIVGHGDKAHPHLHMMINRVHPETGKAWSTSHDYRRFDRIMRLLSEENGFRYVPPHSFHPGLTDELPKAPNSNATHAARRGARTERPQWPRAQSRSYGELVSDKLDAASTWDDMEIAFAEAGLTVEPKGQGIVVGNSKSYAKLSALRLTASAKELERKFGMGLAEHRSTRRPPVRHWWDVDEVDVAKAIGSRNDFQKAVERSKARRKAWLASAAFNRQLEAELRGALKPRTKAASRTPKAPCKGTR